jgi:GT2 family glycosyltransferase
MFIVHGSVILRRAMTMEHQQLAIIVVAYGHAAQLGATLRAIRQQDYPDSITIVVENGDGSSAAVARRHAGVQVLEPGRNLGFAGGCNLAVAHTDAPYIALINPDLQPQPSFLREIVAPLAEPQVGVVGAKLVYPDSQVLQHAGGYLQEPTLLAQHYGYGERDYGQFDTARDVPFVTGAALAVRRATWNMLGGFDQSFFPAYYEEVDLCWRVRQHGMLVRYEPRAVAIHQEAAALGKTSEAYHRLYHRNRLRFIFKHQSDEWLVRHWLPAELQHLRITADDAEITGLIDAYLSWQATFAGIETDAEAGQRSTVNGQPSHGELDWTVEQVAAKRIITPQPFRSRWPFAARARTWLNRVATEAYLRPLLQQQNDYNAALHEAIAALARQRHTTDAAILCQGMLLAKLLSTQRRTAI